MFLKEHYCSFCLYHDRIPCLNRDQRISVTEGAPLCNRCFEELGHQTSQDRRNLQPKQELPLSNGSEQGGYYYYQHRFTS